MSKNRKYAITVICAMALMSTPPGAEAGELIDVIRGELAPKSIPVDSSADFGKGGRSEPKGLFPSVHDLSVCNNAAVRKHLLLYLSTGRPYVRKAIAQSHLYIDIMKEEFDKNPDIPRDLIYLPLLESAFNPHAVSRSKAVGLWQFLVTTSSSMGLKTDRWVDERRDAARSTETAIRYLKTLYGEFGNWELAIAAYNGGNGYLNRTMARHGIRDFWKLRESGALRKETAEFVPRYLALLVICRNQELFCIREEIPVLSAEKSALVELNRQVRIQDVSRLSGVSVAVLKKLNPELNGDMTPPEIERYHLRITEKGAVTLRNNLEALYAVKIPRFKTHVVRRGENLMAIAQRYGGTMDGIMRYNRLKNPSIIRPGTILHVPY